MGLLLFLDFLPLLAVNGISASDEVVGAGLDHASQSPEQSEDSGGTIHVHTPVGRHSGSDTVMMKEFLTVITSVGAQSRSNADASVESHLAALAAEESRLMSGKPIFIQEEYKKI